MEKDITIRYDDKFFNFTTLEWKVQNSNTYELISEMEMHNLIQWLENENKLTKRVKCINSGDLILFRSSIKYVKINE